MKRIRTGTPAARMPLLAVLAGLVTACGVTVPDPPTPLALELPPISPGPRLSPVSAEPVWLAPTLPPLPIIRIPLDVRWWPERPRQASAMAVRIARPAGVAVEDVRARLAGRDVRLGPTPDGWAGVAGLPLDSAGFFLLEVTAVRAGLEERESRAVRVVPRRYPSTRIRISAGGAGDPEVDARIARERELIRDALSRSGDRWYPVDSFGWPRPPIRTSPFGQRRVFNGAVRSRHLGLDLRGRRGSRVEAAAAGRVILTGSFFYQGNAVYLDHGLGLVTAYFHLTSIDVDVGDVVVRGDLLGRVGSTGRSTAPHLHWSAYVEGENVDPESLVGFELYRARTPADDAAGEPRP